MVGLYALATAFCAPASVACRSWFASSFLSFAGPLTRFFVQSPKTITSLIATHLQSGSNLISQTVETLFASIPSLPWIAS
jgi:hypothetical protein